MVRMVYTGFFLQPHRRTVCDARKKGMRRNSVANGGSSKRSISDVFMAWMDAKEIWAAIKTRLEPKPLQASTSQAKPSQSSGSCSSYTTSSSKAKPTLLLAEGHGVDGKMACGIRIREKARMFQLPTIMGILLGSASLRFQRKGSRQEQINWGRATTDEDTQFMSHGLHCDNEHTSSNNYAVKAQWVLLLRPQPGFLCWEKNNTTLQIPTVDQPLIPNVHVFLKVPQRPRPSCERHGAHLEGLSRTKQRGGSVTFGGSKDSISGKVQIRWMFDLDYLTDSMNYIPVSVQNQANPAGSKEVIDIDVQTEEDADLMVVSSTSLSEKIVTKKTHSQRQPSSTPISKSAEDIMTFRKELDALALKHLGPVPTTVSTSTNPVNTGSINLNTAFEKVKKLEDKLRKKRKSKETKDAQGQDQDVPSQTDQGDTFATPEKSKGSGEAQEEQISPSTLEAAQILTNVASEGFKGSQAPLGSKIYRRKPKSKPTPTKILHFEEPDESQVNTGSTLSAQVNTAEVNTAEVNTAEVNTAEVNTAELNAVSTPSAQVNTAEVNTAALNTGETERVQRLQAKMDAKTQRQIDLDALLARRVQEQEEEAAKEALATEFDYIQA
ncbi:hypothetical protein Tco_0503290, partial [Tanacetum coccineum]